MDITFKYSDFPSNWAICYQHECPLAETCLRHHAAELAPADLRNHNCVLPGARKDDACALFVADKRVRIAYGMTRLFQKCGRWKAAAMRKALETVFGCRAQFYRYRAGRWPISPRQQQRVAAVFRQFGETEEPCYDRVVEEYHFASES